MAPQIPEWVWEKYTNVVPPAVLEKLQELLRSSESLYLTAESFQEDSVQSTAETRALLDDLADGGHVTLEIHRRCPCCNNNLTDQEAQDQRCSCGREFQDGEVPEASRVYVRTGNRTRDVRWAITIHGMNTTGIWQQEFSWRLARLYGYSIPVGIYKYGNVRLAPFLSFLKRKQVRKFSAYIKKLNEEMRSDGAESRPDVIAHSFGTWLLAKAMTSEDAPNLPPLGRVVLTGSIVRPDFDWGDLIRKGRVESVLCHQARKDLPARISHWFIRDSGPSSVRGFNDRLYVQHVISTTFGHSDYFSGENIGAVLTDDWTPFLTGPTLPQHAFVAATSINEPDPWKPSRWRFVGVLLLVATMCVIAGAACFLVTSMIFGFSHAMTYWRTKL